jgi:hypothetical protein
VQWRQSEDDVRRKSFPVALIVLALAGCNKPEVEIPTDTSKDRSKPDAYLWISHTDTTWAGMGFCIYDFKFDAPLPGPELRDVRIQVDIPDRSGGVELSDEILIDSIGGYNANRYGRSSFEWPCIGGPMVIRSAVAISEEEGPIDLLREGRIQVDRHEPLEIEFGLESSGFDRNEPPVDARQGRGF